MHLLCMRKKKFRHEVLCYIMLISAPRCVLCFQWWTELCTPICSDERMFPQCVCVCVFYRSHTSRLLTSGWQCVCSLFSPRCWSTPPSTSYRGNTKSSSASEGLTRIKARYEKNCAPASALSSKTHSVLCREKYFSFAVWDRHPVWLCCLKKKENNDVS